MRSPYPTLPTKSFTYDPLGNRHTMTDRLGLHQYTYDALSRVTQATHPTRPTESFTYDPVGNRLTSHLSALHTYDAANRLLEDDAFRYTYDANGNLTTKTEKTTSAVTTYTYDLENQLTRIDLPGGVVAAYRYDALGRRSEKNVAGTIQRFVYDQEDLVSVYTASGCWQTTFTHGPGLDQPLTLLHDDSGDCSPNDAVGFREQVRPLQADGLGSITALVSESSGFFRALNLKERYSYDSFGTPTLTGVGADGLFGTADDVLLPCSTFGNPYLFTGREYDCESGLYYYRARYYDPRLGRFLQEDPAPGLIEAPITLHPYAYAAQNPVLLTDPTGHTPLLGAIILGAVLGGFGAGFGTAIAGGSPTQVATAAVVGAVAGGTGTAITGLSLLTAVSLGVFTSGAANVATQFAGGVSGSNFNVASFGMALGTGAITSATGFGLALAAGGPSLAATLASGFGAKLPLGLLGASVNLNIPPLSLNSIRQRRFLEKQRETCFADRA